MRTLHIFACTGGGSSQTSFLDTFPSAPSNGIHSPAPSCEPGPLMAGSRACMCTRATPHCSTHPRGRDEWIASQRASLASLIPSPASGSAPTIRAMDGSTPSECFARFDRRSRSWKTFLAWSPRDTSLTFSGIWPRSGMMRAGRCSALLMWERRTSATAGGASPAFPTPMVSDAKAGPQTTAIRPSGAKGTINLAGRIAMWPTPCARLGDPKRGMPLPESAAARLASGRRNLEDMVSAARATPTVSGNTNRKKPGTKAGDGLRTQAGGMLSPIWVAWLMGFPLQHLDVSDAVALSNALRARRAWKLSAMPKSHSRRRRRGASSAAPSPSDT